MKDAYYFSHDSNAHCDPKIVDMMFDYGIEGYGMFWMIVESLREQDNYCLKLDRSTYRMISKETMKPVEFIEKYIDDCINKYLLFMHEDGMFYSKSLYERMNKMDEIKKKRKEAIQKRWNKDTSEIQVNNNSNTSEVQVDTKESKVKERKVNKKKLKEINEELKEQLDSIWKLYPRKSGKDKAYSKLPALIQEHGYNNVVLAVTKYRNSVVNTDEKFILMGSTFFNGRINDYIELKGQQEIVLNDKKVTINQDWV